MGPASEVLSFRGGHEEGREGTASSRPEPARAPTPAPPAPDRSRDDVAIVLISQYIAEKIRPLVDAYDRPVPAVLEIPSKVSGAGGRARSRAPLRPPGRGGARSHGGGSSPPGPAPEIPGHLPLPTAIPDDSPVLPCRSIPTTPRRTRFCLGSSSCSGTTARGARSVGGLKGQGRRAAPSRKPVGGGRAGPTRWACGLTAVAPAPRGPSSPAPPRPLSTRIRPH